MMRIYPADHYLIQLLSKHFAQCVNREATVTHQNGGQWAVLVDYEYNPYTGRFLLFFLDMGDDHKNGFTVDILEPEYDIVWET